MTTSGLSGGSQRTESAPTAWRAFDFLLFLLLPMASVSLAGYPLSEIVMLVAVALATVRPAQVRVPGWLLALILVLLTWMMVTALLNDLAPYRRLLHLILFGSLTIFMAQGRFAMRAVARGLALGLVLAAGAGLVGLGNGGYEGRLTGVFGDPNLAGFYLTALGAVAVSQIPGRRRRLVFLAVIMVLVGLTLSRTSLLAMGLVGVWIVTSRRLSPVANIAVMAGLLYVIAQSLDYLRLIGPFSERAGSDQLRDRIIELERLQISQHPWLGNGPGTSTVLVDGQPFFFHNSYLALQNEGGWVAVAIFVILGLAALSSLARLPRTVRTLWLEGGIIAVATCAANLGEVLLELPTAVVIGAGVLHATRSREGGHRDTAESRSNVTRLKLR